MEGLRLKEMKKEGPPEFEINRKFQALNALENIAKENLLELKLLGLSQWKGKG